MIMPMGEGQMESLELQKKVTILFGSEVGSFLLICADIY